ncbi:MAG TPA: M48 family metalloprotease [Candidatus Dormibacteraeota bacterium]|nr:M48 family metalloprotease [Candidatus Dormibacteraeota bacterium]
MAKFLPRAAALVLTCGLLAPMPAEAMSSQREIAFGQRIERGIDEEIGTVANDPLLTAWVDRVFATLTPYTQRRDIPYRVRILDSETPNAFSLPGGTVYVTKGLLNFVRDDDELAAVLGHELGHEEHHHIVKLYDDVRGANTLLTIFKFFSPLVDRFGDLAAGLVLLKISRIHELQADQYGLSLMTQAGYDPETMVDFMARLGSTEPTSGGIFSRYFETHPGTADRVSHLQGYPEIDRRTEAQATRESIHDLDEGRYADARIALARLVAKDPDNVDARIALARAQMDLGYAGLVRQTLAPLADDPRAQAIARANAEPVPFPAIDADGVLAALEAARRRMDARTRDLTTRIADGRRDTDAVAAHLGELDYDIPMDGTGGIAGVGDDSRLATLLREQLKLVRDTNHLFDEATDTFDQAPAIHQDDLAILDALRDQLEHPNSNSNFVLAHAHSVVAEVDAGDAELLRAVDAARGSLAVAFRNSAAIDAYMDAFAQVKHYPHGDLAQGDLDRLMPLARAAQASFVDSSKAADASSDEVNDAQARALTARIALLSVDATPARFAAYRAVLAERFAVTPPTLEQMRAQGAAPATVAVACILAAERHGSPQANLASLRDRNPVGAAEADGVRGETLQLALGLIWAAYRL